MPFYIFKMFIFNIMRIFWDANFLMYDKRFHLWGGFFGVKRHVYLYEHVHLYTDKHAVLV